MKVRVIETGDIIDISPHYIGVKDGKLFNYNTGHYEAVGGDIVTSGIDEYHILKGEYTDFQVLPCEEEETNCIILSAEKGRRKSVRHINHVKEVKEYGNQQTII